MLKYQISRKIASDFLTKNIIQAQMCIRDSLQVLLNGHFGKNAAAFRHLRQAKPQDFIRRNGAQIRTAKMDPAIRRLHQAADGMQRSRFPGACLLYTSRCV